MPKKGFIPNKLRPWLEARKRFRLSHVHIQMARELGMTPKSLGKLRASGRQSWKLPLPAYLEELYEKRFKRSAPESVLIIETGERFQPEASQKKYPQEPEPRPSPNPPKEDDEDDDWDIPF